MLVPERADRLGAYGGLELFYEFISNAKFSPRAMAYIYAARPGSRNVQFAQVSAVHRNKMGDFTEDEIERRLAVDAVSRAKIRIADRSYEIGQIYTIEVDASAIE